MRTPDSHWICRYGTEPLLWILEPQTTACVNGFSFLRGMQSVKSMISLVHDTFHVVPWNYPEWAQTGWSVDSGPDAFRHPRLLFSTEVPSFENRDKGWHLIMPFEDDIYDIEMAKKIPRSILGKSKVQIFNHQFFANLLAFCYCEIIFEIWDNF
jgi:hypothetical protein